MKALVILGSPRKNMNTDTLLNKAIEGMKENDIEVEKVALVDLQIHPCTACGACEKTGFCIIKDDMSKLYKKFDEADIVIIASPIYFNSISSLTKIMVDRCQMFWSSKYVLNQPSINQNKKRRGVFIATCGSIQKGQEFLGATLVMDLFFKAINTKYMYNLLAQDTDQVFTGDRPKLLQEAFEIGKKLAEISK
ncbi:flavodoxin family protein [Inediibacterium massiliense]|uniref:flavodoxin family protein n=1 Tax=Inediibacterium massiliense TaxID=1658111 RepID=UPI000DA5F0FC|nr:flavodoxin family protein [Inediibacterium massiliense]